MLSTAQLQPYIPPDLRAGNIMNQAELERLETEQRKNDVQEQGPFLQPSRYLTIPLLYLT